MTFCVSFPAQADARSRVLVLGSMPGRASLDASQYYAHPRNLFWPIMGELAGASPELPYAQRVRKLNEAGIGVRDVLQSCVRPGSLDAAISAEAPNDFATFFAVHPAITHVFFNGKKAEASFQRHVARHHDFSALTFIGLPSTSPAHAGMSFADKLAAWRAVTRV